MRIIGSAAAVAAATRDDALAEVERLERAAEAERKAIGEAAAEAVTGTDHEERIAEAQRHARQVEADEEWAAAQEDLRVRDAWMQSAVERGRRTLAAVGVTGAAEWLDALIEEAAGHLPPGPCTVLVASAVRPSMTPERVARLGARTGRAVTIEYAAIGGGCVVLSADRAVAFDNTVDARQRRLEPVWRAALARAYADAIAGAAEAQPAPGVEVA